MKSKMERKGCARKRKGERVREDLLLFTCGEKRFKPLRLKLLQMIWDFSLSYFRNEGTRICEIDVVSRNDCYS